MLIAEFAIIFIKIIGTILNIVIGFLESISPIQSPYVRGFFDVVFEGFIITGISRGNAFAFIIFIILANSYFFQHYKVGSKYLGSVLVISSPYLFALFKPNSYCEFLSVYPDEKAVNNVK